ncbi:protein GVQW3-like [Stegodyphus dumicola]|uniref:protein GVQW3-like n=1 Tax=Stegodyphus dumicola TaxID=202533 RepID=UPI0015AC5410|nr:protein GVQW3-like [Stegodyphus dumicola]
MIKQAYAGEACSRIPVLEWHKRFHEGRDLVQDDPRADTERVKQLLQEERRVTVHMISKELNLNRDVGHQILCEDLRKHKLNARIVPHSLADEKKEDRRRISAELLNRARRNPTFVS